MDLTKIGFGGGCHWCTEGVFQMLRGVRTVDQGFIHSWPPADAWAEAVVVTFDPGAIGLSTLVEVHLRTHSAKDTYKPESKYRSAVYTFNGHQRDEVNRAIALFATEGGESARTRALDFVSFKPSHPRYRNYYRADPDRPFCRRYIDPKLDYIRQHFADIALPDTEMLGG